MHIIKSTGVAVPFDERKIISSLVRAGADSQLAEAVADAVTKETHERTTTADIFNTVIRELKKRNALAIASTYDLRNALTKLGPAGFNFELYIASLLREYGWQTEIPENELRGLCVDHEVDVIATKDNETVMIEAKFRNTFGDVVTLKDIMATWARFQDLLDGERAGMTRHLDKLWIMTNGKFTDRAEQFGICKGIHMFSWNSPSHTLPNMIDKSRLYPVTILNNVTQTELQQFSRAGIMLCRDIADHQAKNQLEMVASKTGIAHDRLVTIANVCTDISARH